MRVFNFIFPNPSNGIINIELDLLKTINLEISILNYLGEIIFVDEITYQKGQYKRAIDLGKFASGIYLLNIHNENHNINKKIVIQ